MNRGAILVLLLIALAVTVSTFLYSRKEQAVSTEYGDLRAAFRTIHPHLRPGSAVALMGRESRGTVYQQGRTLLSYASLHIRKSSSEIREDTLLLAYGPNASPVISLDSAGFRIIWKTTAPEGRYLLAVRSASAR